MRLTRRLVAIAVVAGGCRSFGADAPGSEPEPPDASPTADSAVAVGSDASEPERDARGDDVAPIKPGSEWTSPNGAEFSVGPNGVTLKGALNTHAVLVPAPDLPIPSDDYTLFATIYTAEVAELGVVVRLGSDRPGGMMVGSRWGTEQTPFLSVFPSAEYSPDHNRTSFGDPYEIVGDTRYHFEVEVRGSTVTARVWRDGLPRPTKVMKRTDAFATGRGVGIYVFQEKTVRLEDLYVTVP